MIIPFYPFPPKSRCAHLHMPTSIVPRMYNNGEGTIPQVLVIEANGGRVNTLMIHLPYIPLPEPWIIIINCATYDWLYLQQKWKWKERRLTDAKSLIHNTYLVSAVAGIHSFPYYFKAFVILKTHQSPSNKGREVPHASREKFSVDRVYSNK